MLFATSQLFLSESGTIIYNRCVCCQASKFTEAAHASSVSASAPLQPATAGAAEPAPVAAVPDVDVPPNANVLSDVRDWHYRICCLWEQTRALGRYWKFVDRDDRMFVLVVFFA